MPKYVTKTTRIEAVQWDGQLTTLQSLSQSLGDIVSLGPHSTLVILTPEGLRNAALGDWIVKDLSGSAFPMNDSLFSSKFEPLQQAIADY